MDATVLDQLYALPLAEFTRARDELAKELRKAGEKEAADEVKALRKPSISAWAINQLVRNDEIALQGLLRAGERLREAQAKVVSGGGADDFRAATQAERDAVARLVRQARPLLESAGHSATDATVDRIAATLHAAAVDDEARELLRSGRLTEDLDPTAFPLIPGGAAPKPRPKTEKPKRDTKELERRRAQVAKAREEHQRLRAEAADAEAAAKEAQRLATRARQVADEKLTQAERAAAALERAERALRDA